MEELSGKLEDRDFRKKMVRAVEAKAMNSYIFVDSLPNPWFTGVGESLFGKLGLHLLMHL